MLLFVEQKPQRPQLQYLFLPQFSYTIRILVYVTNVTNVTKPLREPLCKEGELSQGSTLPEKFSVHDHPHCRRGPISSCG